jgi:hypothetical protein
VSHTFVALVLHFGPSETEQARPPIDQTATAFHIVETQDKLPEEPSRMIHQEGKISIHEDTAED